MHQEKEEPLIELQSKINLSRDEYLQEDKLYEKHSEQIEEEIIEKYFRKFCDDHPSRAQIAKDKAQEAIDEISTFHSARVKLSLNVAIANKKSEMLALFLQGAGLKTIIDDFDAVNEEVLRKLIGTTTDSERSKVDPEEALRTHRKHARDVCGRLISIQSLAAQVLRLRRETLQSIRDNYLSVTFKDVLQRIGDHLAKTPKDEILSKSWDALAEAVAQALEVIIDEELPTARVRRILEALQKGIGIRKAKTNPKDDGTNEMLTLLALLQRSSEVLAELDAEFDELMEVIDDILKNI